MIRRQMRAAYFVVFVLAGFGGVFIGEFVALARTANDPDGMMGLPLHGLWFWFVFGAIVGQLCLWWASRRTTEGTEGSLPRPAPAAPAQEVGQKPMRLGSLRRPAPTASKEAAARPAVNQSE